MTPPSRKEIISVLKAIFVSGIKKGVSRFHSCFIPLRLIRLTKHSIANLLPLFYPNGSLKPPSPIRGSTMCTSASASPSSADSTQNPPESFEYRNTSESYIEEFKNRTPSIRFDTVCSCKQPEHECSVCLNQFEPESEINQLSCGHLFHKVCLDKWLDYWNITCPLCRTPLLPEEEATCLW
ncbi:hypothetical protein CMV_010813 [Castanea mollissima]|uniref:RING-type domain-containing protein n=1 Tax=Castanea mollissima TaxID=60419 RepID=A0A8J4VPD0_9ROSI|nr:hypothetical protein CMV_010813 [Castanea mollissima]